MNYVYLIGTPEYRNIDDYAIAFSEKKYIREILPAVSLREYSSDQYWEKKDELVNEIKDGDLILLHGGGNLGNLRSKEENLRMEILCAFPNNQVIIMPQSVAFTDVSVQNKWVVEAKERYNRENCMIACRDQNSYLIVQQAFECHSVLVPDMVMYRPNFSYVKTDERSGILLIIREDKEKRIESSQWDCIISLLTESGYSYSLKEIVRKSVKTEQSEQKSRELLSEIGGAQLVITDWLHGMILSAIAGTPCIAFDDFYHEVSGSYDWFKKLKYINKIENPQMVDESLICDLIQKTHNKYPTYQMRKYFQPLSEYILNSFPAEVTGISYEIAMRQMILFSKSKIEAQCIVAYRAAVKPTISVIIPVYNTSKFITECVHSVSQQTRRDIEIICVNDGSTDNSLDCLLELAEEDERISVYTQENAGVSAARNAGVRVSKGIYLYFMDSDDYIESDALEQAAFYMKEEQLDIVFFNGTSFLEDNECKMVFNRLQNRYERLTDYFGVFTGPDLMVRFLENEEYLVECYLQMVSRDFFIKEQLWFENSIIYEDNLYTYRCFLHATHAACINKSLYHRRVRLNSIVTSPATFKAVYGFFKCYCEMLNVYNDKVQTLTPYQKEIALEPVRHILNGAKSVYARLTIEEQQFYKGMDFGDRMLFKQLIVDSCHQKQKVIQLQEQIRKEKKKTIIYKEKMHNYRDSSSYKLGHVILWLPIKIRKILKRSFTNV